MRPKSLILLALALGCGLVASIGISQVLKKDGDEAPEADTAPVLVAMADIPTGDTFTAETVKLEEWPVEKIPNDALTQIEEIDGRRAKQPVYTGEVILSKKLIGKDVDPFKDIPKGYKVVAVKVAPDTGAHLLQPGDRVDVMVFIRAGVVPDVKGNITATFLHNIRVFAVDNSTGRTESGEREGTARTVSLTVTPDEGRMLMSASELGRIRMVMRRAGEATEEDVADSWIKPILLPKSGRRGSGFAVRLPDPSDLGKLLQRHSGGTTEPDATPTRVAGAKQFRQIWTNGSGQVQVLLFNDVNKPPTGVESPPGIAVGGPNEADAGNKDAGKDDTGKSDAGKDDEKDKDKGKDKDDENQDDEGEKKTETEEDKE